MIDRLPPDASLPRLQNTLIGRGWAKRCENRRQRRRRRRLPVTSKHHHRAVEWDGLSMKYADIKIEVRKSKTSIGTI